MPFQQYNVYDGLTACRLVATSNQSGTYVNGPLNNGVSATLTFATGVLTIDSVVVVLGDSVALVGQSNANENGIYICTQQGAVGISAVLTRRQDFQCIEQIKVGQWTTIGAGTVSAGSMFVVVEPLPARFGIDNLSLTAAIPAGSGSASTKAASNPASPTVASVNGATVNNALAVFADTAGTVKAQTTTSTLGFGLTLATGNLQTLTGNLIAGSSGNVGTLTLFPATAANGTFILSPVNAGGAFNTTLSNGVMGQSTVYTIPDILAATGGIVVSTAAVRLKSVFGAAAAGGAAAQSFTDAFCTAGSVVIGNWVTQANAAQVVKIVPGAGSFVVTSTADAGVGTFSYIIQK